MQDIDGYIYIYIHVQCIQHVYIIYSYSILKSRDITLPTEVCIVKVMVFPEVMYGCES